MPDRRSFPRRRERQSRVESEWIGRRDDCPASKSSSFLANCCGNKKSPRDSRELIAGCCGDQRLFRARAPVAPGECPVAKVVIAVSYTHLTLPTSDLV